MISLSNVSYAVKSENDSERIILSDINLRIEKGTRLGIMGRNGSGKTTLAKLIAGLILPSLGEVGVNDIPTSNDKFQANLGKTVGIIFQNPEHQIVTITVERELALGLENYGYATGDIHAHVEARLSKYHLQHLRKKMPTKLSGGEKQKLALASVMILRPEILILDEPMSHLDMEGQEIFKAELDQVMDNSEVTIIYVSQNLDEILDFDRVIILDQRRIAENCSPSALCESEQCIDKYSIEYPSPLILKNCTRDQIDKTLSKLPDISQTGDMKADNSISLECRDIDFSWKGGEKVIENLDLALHRGKVHGLLGKIGCGKSTLALIMSGLLKPNAGKICIYGNPASQADLVKEVVYVFQSPERGLFAETLYEDIAYGPKNYGYGGQELEAMVEKAFFDVGLNIEQFRGRSPQTLSGGEARLAGIAGGLATGKNIIILDEPSEELDYSGRKRIMDLIKRLTTEQKTIMLISHDSDFLFETCDYMSLWIDRKVRTYLKEDLYDKPSEFNQAGIKVPGVVNIANEGDLVDSFRQKGVYSLNRLFMDRSRNIGMTFSDGERDA